MAIDSILQRDVLMRCIRAFFHEREFTEVETPVRLKVPCMELHIDAESSGDHFLRTSPEIFHKWLLAAGHVVAAQQRHLVLDGPVIRNVDPQPVIVRRSIDSE